MRHKLLHRAWRGRRVLRRRLHEASVAGRLAALLTALMTAALWAEIAPQAQAQTTPSASGSEHKPLAIDREAGLLQMRHRAWATRDGAPGPVLAIAQTLDGWLWIGTPAGLYRFDGVAFERMSSLGGVRLRSPAVRSLTVDHTGALWIGYLYGGIDRYAGLVLKRYGTEQGLPTATVGRIAVDSHGTVWAAATRGLFRLDGGSWQRALPERTLIMMLLVDRSDRVWFNSGDELLVLDPGAVSARPVGRLKHSDAAVMAEGPDGSVWLASNNAPLQRFGPEDRRPIGAGAPLEAVAPLLFDEVGMAWFCGPAGLWRADAAAWLHPNAPVPKPHDWFGARNGLSGSAFYAMLQDREGSVWIGTDGGLDRFHRNRLTRIAASRSNVPVALAASGPDVWIGRSGQPLLRLGARPHEFTDVRADFSALLPDVGNTTWVGSRKGSMWRIDADRASPVHGPLPPGTGAVVQALTRDRAGRVWVAGRGGPFRLEGGAWSAMGGRDGLPADPVISLASDASGRVWLGYSDSRVALYDDAQVTLFSHADGLDVGTVLALHVAGDRVWVGGDSGLAVGIGGRFRMVGDGKRQVFQGVSGVWQTPAGELWLNTADGVVRIPVDEVSSLVVQPNRWPRHELFDRSDGLSGQAPQAGGSLPTLVASSDGQLWISDDGFGVVSIDPAAVVRNTVPPPVSILSVRANDRDQVLHDGLILPALTRSVQIRYTGLGLAAPERETFRYRLAGIDESWQEVQTRRVALYTNLEPGQYRFEVMAANEDGVWSRAPAMLGFTIEPALHQTVAYRAMCLAALVGALWYFYVLRVRVLTARAVEKARERQRERDRIARDLHDTLLQGVYGLLVGLQSVLDRAMDGSSRKALSHALDNAERLVDESRQRVAGLRAVEASSFDLAGALQIEADRLAGSGGLMVKVIVDGLVKCLLPHVRDEIYYIASEALMNVRRHAEARSVHLELQCSARQVRLLIRDDGRGIEPSVLEQNGISGHWGLQGMRERAARIGGRLTIAAAPGGGTDVELLAPVEAAYLPAARHALLRRLTPCWLWRLACIAQGQRSPQETSRDEIRPG